MPLVEIKWDEAKPKFEELLKYHILTDEEIELWAEFLDALFKFKGLAMPVELADGATFKMILTKMKNYALKGENPDD